MNPLDRIPQALPAPPHAPRCRPQHRSAKQATHYRVPPKVSAALSKRQVGQAGWIKDLSWSTQMRLSHRFKTLKKRKFHHNKIKVSVARELVGFLWELGTKIEAAHQPS